MIKNKKDYLRYLTYEENRMHESYSNFSKELKRILKYIKLYRKDEYYHNTNKPKLITNIIDYKLEKLNIKYGFHIPINTIEEGLCIVHIGPIYINSNAKIGKNLRIHPMTTIGKGLSTDKCPVIKDGVWIGPGSRIYGDITIGNNCVIGTNSVVNKDVPDDVTVAGAPAKIINHKKYQDYLDEKKSRKE